MFYTLKVNNWLRQDSYPVQVNQVSGSSCLMLLPQLPPCLQWTKVHLPGIVSGLSQPRVSCTHTLLTLSSHPYKLTSLQISTFQLVKLMNLFKEIYKACLHGPDI